MIQPELEKYGLALNQIILNYSAISNPDLSQVQKEIIDVRDSLVHRARSINHHSNLLKEMSRNSKDQQLLNHPRNQFDFVSQIYTIQFPAEVFFEDLIFNFGSYYDYLAKMIFMFFKTQHDHKDWRQLIKELNKKAMKQNSLFDQIEIFPATVAGIIILNKNRIRPLYDYRSDLIHNKSVKTSGKKHSVYTQGESPSLKSEIIIEIPNNIVTILSQLVDFKIENNDLSSNIFETSKSLSTYFWNTNIQLLNLLISENNKMHRVKIQKLRSIVDNV